MAKLSRVVQKIFGSTAQPQKLGVIGSFAAGNPQTTTDPATMQSLSNYLQGWFQCVLGNNSPSMEDRNALDFLITRQLAYVYQQGVPEWDSSTEYHSGSMVNSGGTIYVSIINNNTGNSLTDIESWRSISSNPAGVNYLVNPTFEFAQCLESSGANDLEDGEFCADQWMVQTDAPSDDIQFNRYDNSSVEPGTPYVSQFEAAFRNTNTGNDYYFGAMNMLSNAETVTLLGRQVSFGLQWTASVPANTNIKMAIVAWTGTADQFNRAAVSSWASTPTLKANFEFISVSDSLSSVGSVINTMSQLSGTVPYDCRNLGVMWWTDGAQPDGASYMVTTRAASLEIGPSISPFRSLVRPSIIELQRCQAYYEKSYEHLTPVGTSTTNGIICTTSRCNNTIQIDYPSSFPLKAEKHRTVTNSDFTAYTATGSSGWLYFPGATGYTPEFSSGRKTTAVVGTFSGLTAGQAMSQLGHYVCDARLGV